MIVLLKYEATDVVPPELAAQITKRVARVIEDYGLRVCVESPDRSQELAAFQRFYDWNSQRIRDDYPKTPAESEVK